MPGALEQVMQMRQRNPNISDQEIITELRKQFSPKEINEALNHAQIKNAVSDIRGDEEQAPMPGQYGNEQYSEQQGYDQYAGQYGANEQGQGGEQYGEQQVYTPQPQQYYPQQGYGGQYGDYYNQPSVNTNTIVEVAEQVFDEKISDISKSVDSVNEFKALTQARLEHLNERLKRIEAIIDKLQSSILEKVGSYGSNLESVKKEMSMMQDSFSKIAEGVGRAHSSSEESEEEKVSKKKK